MNISNLFGKSVVFMSVFVTFGVADAAQNGRDGAVSSQSGRTGMMSARMPSIPTTGLNTIGNPAVHTVSQPAESHLPHIVPTPNPNPNPNPDPNPDPDPEPDSDCEDGGVRNSDYTINLCMNDLLQCINNGGLSGGLNDLFCNQDVRNAVMNGMMLCQDVVDRCIHEVRVDCRNIYAQSSDVWLDFDSRIVQPEYYNFVLRKTGLTPHQAENTCLLLDRNTYGPSFAAVSDVNAVNTEYMNRVGAYNEAMNGTLSKLNPQGATVNTTGYDGNRGHYARWDACKAECLIRVGAYNKDQLITNNWLWGAMGNDEPAEVWQKAGATFTCNKDLFDMSLLNDTKTAAVVGVGGGSLLGAGIGAGVGAANYEKKKNAYNDPCSDASYREKLGAKIYASNKGGILKSYAYKNVVVRNGRFIGDPIFDEDSNFNKLTEEQCRDLHDLNEKVYLYQSKVNECLSNETNAKISRAISYAIPTKDTAVYKNIVYQNGSGRVEIAAQISCDMPAEVKKQDIERFDSACKFEPLRDGAAGILCKGKNECLEVSQIQYQINELRSLLKSLTPELTAPKSSSKGAEVAKGALIGGATGAGVGGIVTGITALVERSNITCKVGDGLNTVALGKSHTIDSLKDFYVKWNLNLPDVISPTSAVSDLASWQQACRQFNGRLHDCPNVQINLVSGNTYTLVQSACVVSGSICIVNSVVAQTHGIQ